LGVRIITPSITACPPTMRSLSLALTGLPRWVSGVGCQVPEQSRAWQLFPEF